MGTEFHMVSSWHEPIYNLLVFQWAYSTTTALAHACVQIMLKNHCPIVRPICFLHRIIKVRQLSQEFHYPIHWAICGILYQLIQNLVWWVFDTTSSRMNACVQLSPYLPVNYISQKRKGDHKWSGRRPEPLCVITFGLTLGRKHVLSNLFV